MRGETPSLVLVLLVACSGESGQGPPNILFIVADDLGYGDLGSYGGEHVETPRLDELARQGVRLTDFYVASPMCSPSRASLLTGRLPARHGLLQALTDREGTDGLDPAEVLLPELLRDAGYTTGLVGKWHLGTRPEHLPRRRGFDRFFGMLRASSGYFRHTYQGIDDLWDGETPVDRHGEYSTDLFSEEAVAFLEEHRGEPWFLMLSYNAPHLADDRKHVPAPVSWREQFATIDAPWRRKEFCSAVAAMDAGIGRVLDALDRLDLADDTLVVFLSDNGGRPPYASTGPFRGRKDTTAEGGIHVPCLMRWPGRLPAGSVCAEPIIAMDLMVSALAVAGAVSPADRPLDGIDVLPALAGDETLTRPLFWEHESRRTTVTGERRHDRVVRQGRWRLTIKPDGTAALHDLVADPGQANELSAEHPEEVERLRGLLDAHSASLR